MCGFVFPSCVDTFPGADWFSLTLRGYCSITRLILCDFGF
jgi:hypothetical protein